MSSISTLLHSSHHRQDASMVKYELVASDDAADRSLLSDLEGPSPPATNKSTTFFPTRGMKYLGVALFAANVVLAITNLYASQRISGLLDPTDTIDIAQLPRADQYIGLSDLSRYFCESGHCSRKSFFFDFIFESV